MLDWIKERKVIVTCVAVVLILIVYFYMSFQKESPQHESQSNWSEDAEIMEEVDPEQQMDEKDKEILVDVKGAVKSPGVYKALDGERVIDLIDKAGGLKDTANEAAVNFAMRVTDEMVLYVPEKGEETETLQIGSLSKEGEKENVRVNLNKADQAELETLPGIGPAKAQAIIEYRETNGPFKKPEDIMSISGFGEKTFEKLKDHISVQ